MQFLEHVYVQHSPDQPAAEAATAVNRLLQGCAELLRPAANCAVEWRCAALSLMTTAVEDFVEEHLGVSDQAKWMVLCICNTCCDSANPIHCHVPTTSTTPPSRLACGSLRPACLPHSMHDRCRHSSA